MEKFVDKCNLIIFEGKLASSDPLAYPGVDSTTWFQKTDLVFMAFYEDLTESVAAEKPGSKIKTVPAAFVL